MHVGRRSCSGISIAHKTTYNHHRHRRFCIVLSASCHGGCGVAVVCSCSSVLRSAPLAELHRELGDSHRHLGHREKECTDLMMYRKSEEPHNNPRAAIGRPLCSWKPSPLWTGAPYKKTCRERRMWIHSESVRSGTCSALLRSRVVGLHQSPLQRSRRFQRGKTESRRVET